MNRPTRKAVAITGLAAVGLGLVTAQILSQPAPSDHRDPGVVLEEGTPTPTGASSTAQSDPTLIEDAMGSGQTTTGVAHPPAPNPDAPAPGTDDADDQDDDSDGPEVED